MSVNRFLLGRGLRILVFIDIEPIGAQALKVGALRILAAGSHEGLVTTDIQTTLGHAAKFPVIHRSNTYVFVAASKETMWQTHRR
jgi:hypothetical protein